MAHRGLMSCSFEFWIPCSILIYRTTRSSPVPGISPCACRAGRVSMILQILMGVDSSFFNLAWNTKPSTLNHNFAACSHPSGDRMVELGSRCLFEFVHYRVSLCSQSLKYPKRCTLKKHGFHVLRQFCNSSSHIVVSMLFPYVNYSADVLVFVVFFSI